MNMENVKNWCGGHKVISTILLIIIVIFVGKAICGGHGELLKIVRAMMSIQR